MAAQIRQTVVDVPAERPKPARPKAKKRTGEQLLDEQGNIDTSTLRKLAPNVAEQEAMMTIRRFQQFDELHGGKGELDEEDVLKLLNDLLKDRLGQLVIQRLTKYQFAIADRDKNGTLNLEEFMTIFAFIMEQCPKGSQKAEDTLAGLSANQKPKPEQRKSNSNSLESSARSVIVESTVVPKYVPEPAPAAAAPAPPPRAPERKEIYSSKILTTLINLIGCDLIICSGVYLPRVQETN